METKLNTQIPQLSSLGKTLCWDQLERVCKKVMEGNDPYNDSKEWAEETLAMMSIIATPIEKLIAEKLIG